MIPTILEAEDCYDKPYEGGFRAETLEEKCIGRIRHFTTILTRHGLRALECYL